MRCVQPGSRRVAGADGTNGPATSAGAGVCPVQNRPSRRATAEDPELALPHWHTLPPLQRTAGARVAGCAWRWWTARRHPAARLQLPRHRWPLSTVRAGARRASPLPSLRLSTSAAAPIPRLGRRLVGAARHRAAGSVAPLRATYISNVAAERVRERVWGTLPRTRPRHAAHRLSAFQVPHVLAPLAYFDNVCDPPLLPGTSVIAPRLCAHCALSTVPHALSPRRARVCPLGVLCMSGCAPLHPRPTHQNNGVTVCLEARSIKQDSVCPTSYVPPPVHTS